MASAAVLGDLLETGRGPVSSGCRTGSFWILRIAPRRTMWREGFGEHVRMTIDTFNSVATVAVFIAMFRLIDIWAQTYCYTLL